MPREEAARVAAEAGRRGVSLQYGAEDENQHLLLVAQRAAASPARSVKIPGLLPGQRGRIQYAVVHLGQRQALHVVQLCSHADGRSSQPANEELLLAAVS